MLDFSNLPTQSNADIQDFYAIHRDVYTYSVWNKPRGARMVSIILIASGGGGGNAGAGVSTAGGGGGGSAGVCTLLVPAMFIPDTLYIALCGGGLPGSSISTRGNDNIGVCFGGAANDFLLYANNGGRGGPGGAGAAGGSSAMSSACLAGLGVVRSIGGNAGATATAGANGGAGAQAAGTLTNAGASGGGTGAAASAGFRGGHCIFPFNSEVWPDKNQQAGGTATQDGVAGFWGGRGMQQGPIPYFYSCAGGNSSGTTAPAANGGAGGSCDGTAFGAGGGGGGAGLTTGGIGGFGGGSFCRIMAW